MPTLADLPSLLSDEGTPSSSYDSVSDLQAVYRDPRFRADLREYYASKGTGFYDSDDELIERFFSDGNWRDLNTLGAIDALNETTTQSDRMKLVTARLQQVWDRQPAFWQEGGRGLSAIPDIATALIADPINLLGGGSGLVQGGKAARAAYAAGKTLQESVSAGMRAGAVRGALIEGGINAGQEAVVDTALQQRNVELGLQDEVSQTQTALGAGAGALIGGGLGGLMGGLAGRAGGRQAATQAEDLVTRGLTREDIGAMSPADLNTLSGLPTTRPYTEVDPRNMAPLRQATVPNDFPELSPARQEAAAAARAEQERLAAERDAAAKAAQDAANDPEVKYAGHLAAIDQAIDEHRRVLDDYNKSGFDQLSDDDPNKAVYKEHLDDLVKLTALREQVPKLKAEEEQIRTPQGSNILADDATAIQRRTLFEQRFSQFRNTVEQYQTREQINAAILQRAEERRAAANAALDAEAARGAPRPAKAKVDPQGQKAAAQPQAAPAQPAQAAAQAAAPAQPAPAATPAPADTTAPAPAAQPTDTYAAAVELVQKDGKPSSSYIGRKLGINGTEAFKLIQRMEQEGIISPPDPTGKRTILKTSPADPTQAGDAAAASPTATTPGAAAAPTPAAPDAPPARPDGIVITDGARERMASPDMNVDEADFIDWYKGGAPGWANKDKVKNPNTITKGAVGAYKRAVREGLWVGNAKATPEEQPNRLTGLLSANDPYSSTYRNEIQELINDTLRYTAGVEDPGLFREVFEALSTDEKFKSKREDFMLFLDESYKAQGLSANVMEGLSANVMEGTPLSITEDMAARLKTLGYDDKSIEKMKPAVAQRKIEEDDDRQALIAKGWTKSQVEEMNPKKVRELLADIELGFINERATSTASGPRVTMPQGSPITEAEIQQLRDLGYKDATIENMRPSDIRAALRGELAGEARSGQWSPEDVGSLRRLEAGETEELTATEKKRARTLAKVYVEQGATKEEAATKAKQTVISTRAVTETPLPRDAEGKPIEPGKFKNQKDRQTTQSAIRREGIFETAGRNWNNNRIADMLRMGIATKRIPTTEEYWQTRGDTFVSESIGTQGLRRGIEDKYLDPKNFDLVSARIQADENVKANQSSSKLSEEYGRILGRFNERINELLAVRSPTDLTERDLKRIADAARARVSGTYEEAEKAARDKLVQSRVPKSQNPGEVARSASDERARIEETAQKALEYVNDPDSNVDGMAEILGVKLLPKPPKGSDEVTRARMNKERTEDPSYNDVLQILNAGKKAAKKKAAQEKSGGPEIIEYTVESKQSIYRNGQRVEVTSGTAFYDARQMRSFSSFEEAVAARSGIVPVTETDKKSYLRSFLDSWKKGGDIKSLRDQLEKLAAGDFSFAKKTPSGLVNAAGQKLYIMLARKDGDRSVRPRKLSKAQYEAAKDGKDGLSALLGKSNIEDFDIRYTTAEDNPKNDAAMWKLWDSATPVNKMEEVANVYGNRSFQNPLSYNAYAQKTVTELSDDEAEALVFAGEMLKINGKALSYRSAEDAKAAAKAGKLPMYVIEAAENQLAWKTPVSAHKDGMLGIAKHMAALNRIREREAPMGFVLPTAKREESVQQLRAIFEGHDRHTVTQLETMLRRLGGPRKEGPIFKALSDVQQMSAGLGGQYVYRAPNSFGPENSIRMPKPSQIAEINAAKRDAGRTKFEDFAGGRSHPVANLAHELFHWAWYNILNPSDRIEFIEGLSRQLYDKDGNILPIADQLPPTANALESINEIGANLFTQWFMRNRSNRFIMGDANAATKGEKTARLDRWLAGLDRVFDFFKEHVLAIIDRYFHHIPLDPALEAKFAKILPDDRLLAFKDGRSKPPSEFGPKAKYAEKIEQRYKELKFLRRDLDDALVADSHEGVVRAAINISNYFRSIGLNSKKTGIFYPIKSWYKVIHERNKELTFLLTGRRLPDDIIEELETAIAADGKPKSRKDMADADVGDFVEIGLDNPERINASDVFGRFSENQKPTLDDRMARMSPNQLDTVAKIIREIYYDSRPMFARKNELNPPSPEAKYSLKYLLDQLERSLESKHIDLFGTLPKSSSPNILGEIEEAASASAKTRTERSAKAADRKFGDAMAEILDAKNYDYKSSGTEPDSQAATNIKDMSVTAMAREWPRVKGTPRGKEIMGEVKRRLKAEAYPAERVAIPKAMRNMNNEQLNDALFTALREGGEDNARIVSQAANEIHRRAANELATKNNLPKLEPLIADVREAISRETDDNQGVSADIGIPANARATVREALSYVTDRNPEHAYVARTMLYRMYNLMGKTVRATAEDSHLMSMAELGRLAGVEPGAGATGMVVDFRSPVFKSLRRDIRRFAIGLNKQTSTPIDLMHEIGHVVIRGVLSDADRSSVLEFYRAANDTIKDRVAKTYGPKYSGLSPAARDERLAQEWFAESWAQWAAERVARGDILAVAENGKLSDLSLRGKIDTLIDRVTEFVAYVVNGLIGRDDVKQMFRRLTFYGDMFDNRRPKSVADAYGDNWAIPAHMAADYVDESLFRNKVRLEKMQEFVRGTEGADGNGNPVVGYHATTNAYRLSKDTSPDAVLNPSSNGKYGPGTYITFNPHAADKVYGNTSSPRLNSLVSMIENSDLPDDVADDLLELVEVDLNNVRKQIRFNIGEVTVMRDEAEKFADSQEGDLNFSMVREDVGRLEKTLAGLYRKDKAILDTLERNGISPNGVVLPLVHNAKRMANFSEKMRYEPDDPFVTAVVDRVLSYFPAAANDTANAYATFTSLGSIVTGRSLYERLLTMASKNGVSPAQAKIVITNALKELGYDGIRGTFVDRVSREGIPEEITHEGAVIFDTARLKHVDAEEFDPTDDRLYYRALTEVPVAPMGDIVGAIIEGNVDGFSAPVIANAMEAAEAAGVAPRLTDAFRSMIGKRNLTQSEFRTKASAATLMLGSQSRRMAQDGMNWLSKKYEEFFPSVSVEFGKQFYPLLDELRSLPGTDSMAGRWVRRSFGTIPGVGKRLGQQPAAYAKIVAALRRGDGSPEWSALSERERSVAQAVRKTFTAAREMLIKSGDSIGKRENYFPQIWNAEKIAANREAFIEAAVRYFETERTAEGAEIKPDELRMMAERIAMKLTDEEADKYFPPQIRSSNAKAEHLDYSRIFQLEKYPGHLKDFEQFLEDDLEAIAVKYLDGAARRLVQNERFGNATHMFNDYIVAATEGVEGIAKLLSTRKVYRKEFRALEGGEMTNALFELEVGMPFQGRDDLARDFAEGLVRTFQATGRAGAEKALMELSTTSPKTYVRRVEAILGALEDFGGQPGLVDVGAVERAHQSMRLLVGQPLTNPSMGGRFAHNMSKNLRAFNSVTLLSFATLTSLTDIALPIIRSGEFRAWYRGLKQMAQDPEYRQLIRNVGVAIESEVHQHLSTLYGTHSSKHANAFFNATMLTPWTNVQRKIAAATGFEAMKAMQQKAFRTFKEGKPMSEQPAEYRTAHRFLTRYGMADYLPGGAKQNISIDQKMLAEEDVLKLAIVKFADEAIFSPNPNDIPLWAQTPLGSIIFQFKAYPIMMGRMAKWALDEARQGNYKPITYMATIAPGLGAASMAIKDLVQMRGGEENNEAQIRSRNLDKFLGYDEKVHGNRNDFMGWYLESMLASGGFGFLAELLHDVSSQVDNGAYGKVRVMSAIGGPTVGTASAAFDVAAGIQAAAMGGSETGSKERTAVREVARRIPVAGGISSFREGATDAIAGPKRERSTGGWNSDWKGWEQ